MKILLQHGTLRPRPSVERLVERRLLALSARACLEEVVVRLHDQRESDPRFRASVFLRVPGPDVHAAAEDHSVRDAVEKALDAAEAQIASRHGRRVSRRRRSPLLAAAPVQAPSPPDFPFSLRQPQPPPMTTTDPVLPIDLDRFLATNSADDITSTSAFVERGSVLVNPRSLSGLRTLRQPLRAKIAGLRDNALLRARLELLVTYLDECAAERATVSPAIREAAFALLYFLKGFDRIPDTIPEVGLLDDALVVQVVLDRNATALRAHWLRRRRNWPLDN